MVLEGDARQDAFKVVAVVGVPGLAMIPGPCDQALRDIDNELAPLSVLGYFVQLLL